MMRNACEHCIRAVLISSLIENQRLLIILSVYQGNQQTRLTNAITAKIIRHLLILCTFPP